MPQAATDTLNFVTVILSIVIIVSSLLQYSNGYVVSAEQHHRAGLEMNEIVRTLRIDVAAIDEQGLRAFTDRYSATLQKYSINHEDVDFARYQLEQPAEYPWLTWLDKIGIWFRAGLSNSLYWAILIAETAAVISLICWLAYPAVSAALSQHTASAVTDRGAIPGAAR